ncbi:Uncharacterised protein [Sphingobacterium spiritivorum]|uniref:Uncharacterized protein n=1 Tax=Sphingobacterium spiritivorum TaxID=258 RepID=A0A380BL77_SPHSI|nr:hypothetical protein [Sphingobacterium spiritivorum]SUJ02941.1 Uncharacterised protein [Sphingobacterium spiritivorum]
MRRFNKIIKYSITTLLVFVCICLLSYHDDTHNDGNLSFGFPITIYKKSVYVMSLSTGMIGESTQFSAYALIWDITFAGIITLFIFLCYRFIKQRKNKTSK